MDTWFQQIYEDYSDMIFRYLLMQVNDHQQAEDLTQETFIKAYRNKDGFENRSSVYTWLYAIARNVSYDEYRKNRPLAFLPDFFARQPEPEKLTVEERAVIGDEAAALYEELAGLKQNHKEVINLRYIQELSTAETAEVLGWSESKVKSVLFRALPALRSQMEKRGVTHETI